MCISFVFPLLRDERTKLVRRQVERNLLRCVVRRKPLLRDEVLRARRQVERHARGRVARVDRVEVFLAVEPRMAHLHERGGRLRRDIVEHHGRQRAERLDERHEHVFGAVRADQESALREPQHVMVAERHGVVLESMASRRVDRRHAPRTLL